MSLVSRVRARLAHLRGAASADRRSLKRAVDRPSPPNTIQSRRGTLAGVVDAIHREQAFLHELTHRKDRAHPNEIAYVRSPNQSGRGETIQLVVVHVTDSDRKPHGQDAREIASYFHDPSSQVSAHIVIGGSGVTVRCVDDSEKAWHVAGFNGVALGIEQCGRNESAQVWARNEPQLRETARNVALMCKRHHVPLVHGEVSGQNVVRSGVVQHMELGDYGGGHDDCGPGYPFEHMLDLARGYFHRL